MKLVALSIHAALLLVLYDQTESLEPGYDNVCTVSVATTSCTRNWLWRRHCYTSYRTMVTCCVGWTTASPDSLLCDINLRTCESNPCQYDGTCENGHGMYTCNCPDGRGGDHCEVDLRTCESNPCLYGGACENGHGVFTCRCPDGREGDRCEVDMATCDSEPCQNGGSCVNGPDMYTCHCGAGWTGTHCEFDSLPPVVQQCPENITEYTATAQVTIEWQEPVFADPHGQSQASLSAQNYAEPRAVLPWGEYVMQYVAVKPRNGLTSECLFSTSIYPIPCETPVPPANGSVACNGWNSRFGAICTLFCESDYDVPSSIDIETVYVCGASGVWIPSLPDHAACSRRRTELDASVQSEERRQHYYTGECTEPETRVGIQQAYLTVLASHRMASMCTSERFQDQCSAENVDVLCN